MAASTAVGDTEYRQFAENVGICYAYDPRYHPQELDLSVPTHTHRFSVVLLDKPLVILPFTVYLN